MRIPVNGLNFRVATAGPWRSPKRANCLETEEWPTSRRPGVVGDDGSSPATLLLLHGFTGSSANWRPFVASWGERYRLLMVDLIGHGQSEAPREVARYSMDDAIEDLVGILDCYGIERSHVLGYSMGGRLALAMAVRHPERIRSLVLEGSSPGIEEAQARAERRARDEMLAKRIMEEGIEAFVHYWEQIPLFASQKKLSSTRRAHIRAIRLRNRDIGLANSLRGMGTGAQPSQWHALDRVDVPVLLVTGAWDEKFCRIAARMKERLPQAEWHRVANAGHTAHVEQPDVFDTIVMDYLNRIDLIT